MNIITSILQQDAIKSLLAESEKGYIFRQLNLSYSTDLSCDELCRLSFFLTNYVFSNEQKDTDNLSETTYKLLKSINITSPDDYGSFSEVFGMEGINAETLYYFYLANVALKADKIISIRIDLKQFVEGKTSDNWKYRLLNNIMEAYLLLVRKLDGFKDISNAFSIIATLQQEQQQYEENYLKQFSAANELHEAYLLLSVYHLSKALVETASYLLKGYDYRGDRLDATIRQHMDIAKKLAVKEPRLVGILTLFEFGLKTMYRNAIWTSTRFNDKIRQLCRMKAKSDMIELLPSQRDALTKNLLDVASNVTVLQLPTSAGKTLLAEFNIIVTKALRSDSKIIYIVPSRALVNQVYYDLKSDLEPLDFVVEKTSSAIEIDPAEDSFLTGAGRIDILVSTPEKLDLLVRRKHPSVDDVSLFILDEAHTIQNGDRGAKLELLMAILRRERPDAKYMLLSPFIGDAGKVIAEWLGGGSSVSVDRKPSEKLILGINIKGKKNDVFLEVLPSPYESVKPIGIHSFTNPYQLESKGDKDQILEFSVKQFSEEKKTFLVLCYGKTTASNRADFIYDKIDNYTPSDDVKLVKKFIEDEVGRATTLSKVIEKGVVTHHAGISDETKLLIEHLIREKQIKFVCATTTIAEGVNFPVSTVFFDDYRKGQLNQLNSNDFWNIAGRAGRTLVDNYGKILLPFNSNSSINHAKRLISGSSDKIVSVLAELFENADMIEMKINSDKGLPEIKNLFPESLPPLIQYFVHLLTVGENEYFVSEIEDLFKDSLEYYLLDTEYKKQRFIAICKKIYLHIQSKYQDRGALVFADKTGFSVPSVLAAMASASKNPKIKDLKSWSKEELFNSNNSTNLAEKIRVIAALRETALGTDAKEGPFNPDLYAKIIIDWVKGEKLVSIADLHPAYSTYNESEQNIQKRITEFVTKMNDIRFKASWGLSALEGIVRDKAEIKDSHIPSMVYFGVDTEKSLAMRMIGVPRILAVSLQNILEDNLNQYSFSDLRNRIKNLPDTDWDALKPSSSTLNGMEWKRISEILVK